MNIEQTANLQQSADFSALVAQNNNLLNQTIDVPGAAGTWDLTNDVRGRPLLVLQMRDPFDGRCTGEFAPEELHNEAHLSSRLHGLKGALIKVGQWRSELQQLYRSLEQWCQDLPGGAAIQQESLVLREERSGDYEVPRLIIFSHGQKMHVDPVALWVVGADGRVDLKGIGGPFTLLFFQRQGWFYVPETIPMKTLPLTKDLFLELAEACLDG